MEEENPSDSDEYFSDTTEVMPTGDIDMRVPTGTGTAALPSSDIPEPYDPEKWEISKPKNRNDSLPGTSAMTISTKTAAIGIHCSSSVPSLASTSPRTTQPLPWSLCMNADETLLQKGVRIRTSHTARPQDGVLIRSSSPLMMDLTLDDEESLLVDLSSENEPRPIENVEDKENESVMPHVRDTISEDGSVVPVVRDIILEDAPLAAARGTIAEDLLSTTFAEIEKTRQAVREELDKAKVLEEEQLGRFRQLKRFSLGCRIFPPLRPSKFHTITFTVQELFNPMTHAILEPHPKQFHPKWTSDYVPMPCCRQNEHVVVKIMNTSRTNIAGVIEEKKVKTEETISNWNNIQRQLSKPICSCDDLNERINRITDVKEEFNVLKYLIEELLPSDEGYNFFAEVLPFMIKLCLGLPFILTCPLPLLRRYISHSISLTQLQIASLLANAFFCTFPARLQNEDNYPSINFNELFTCDAEDSRLQAKAQKLRCILHYFQRLSNKDEAHNGVVTFTRKSHLSGPDWSTSTKTFTNLVALYNGSIETEGAGMLQVDFANRYVGGGVLGRGTVQEEILFVIYPELLISRLFTEKLFAGEALLVTGCERFSTYFGYSSTFTFGGAFYDVTPHDPKGRRESQIVAIDALYIRKKLTQFNPKFMERELNKAYIGFSIPVNCNATPVAVASGKWGCGVFNGDPELKALLQLMAASESGRDLVLFSFGDSEFQESVVKMYQIIKDKTVGDVWKYLVQYYNLFCSPNENDDKPPKYSLGQMLQEFVYAQDLNESDFCTPPETLADTSTQDTASSSSNMNSESVNIGANVIMPSGNAENVANVNNPSRNADKVDHVNMPSTNVSNVTNVDTRLQTADQVANETSVTVVLPGGTPRVYPVVDVCDSDDEDGSCDVWRAWHPARDLTNNPNDTNTNSVDPKLTMDKERLQRIIDFAKSSSESEDDSAPTGHTKKVINSATTQNAKTVVKSATTTTTDHTKKVVNSGSTPSSGRVVTNEDYRALFSSPPTRMLKKASAKRKLSTSPAQRSSSAVRPRLGESSTSKASGRGYLID